MHKLVKAVSSEFNGIKCNIRKRTAQPVLSMRHTKLAYIIEGQLYPEQSNIWPRMKLQTRRSTAMKTRRDEEQQDGAEEEPPARDEEERR